MKTPLNTEEIPMKKKPEHGRNPHEHGISIYNISVLYFFHIFAFKSIPKIMARPLKNSDGKELSTTGQSNYLTTAKYDYTPQEKRILYRVVEQAWKHIDENKINLKEKKVAELVVEDKSFLMPITHFMNKEQLRTRGGTTDQEVYEAFLSLKAKDISGYNSVQGTWMVASIVCSAYRMKNGMIRFSVAHPVWQSALDFSAGWSPIELTVAMELKSAYSMRFYELAKKWSDTKIWKVSIEEFRETFGCKDKYQALYDLKRYVVETAQKELDKVSPWSFTYEQIKVGHKVRGFTFYFYENKKNVPERAIRKQLLSKHPQGILPEEVKAWLTNKMNLNQKQRESNIVLFDNLCRIFKDDTITELEETFQYISNQGFRPQENIGWFIQNLKKKAENASEGISQSDKNKLDGIASQFAKRFNN